MTGTYAQVRCGGRWWHVRADLAGAAWFLAQLAVPSRLLEPPAQPLRPYSKHSPRAIVRRTFAELPEQPLIIKRYRPKSCWSRFKDLFRGSQVSRTLQRTRELESLAIPVASVLAAHIQFMGGWGESWLIMDEVPAAQNLYDRDAECGDPLDRRGLLRGLGRLMARLHDANYEHTDPSLTNFLVSFANPGDPAVVLIDLDGLRRRQQTLGRVAKGLRRLAMRAHVSRREQLRFLMEYVDTRQSPINARVLASAVGPLPGKARGRNRRLAPGAPALF